MKRKYTPAVVLFVLAAIIWFGGILFRLMHWPGGSMMLIIGYIVMAVGGIALILTIVGREKNSKPFP